MLKAIILFTAIWTCQDGPLYADESAKVSEDFGEELWSVLARLMTALDVAYSEGIPLGRMPADPSNLGLLQPAGY